MERSRALGSGQSVHMPAELRPRLHSAEAQHTCRQVDVRPRRSVPVLPEAPRNCRWGTIIGQGAPRCRTWPNGGWNLADNSGRVQPDRHCERNSSSRFTVAFAKFNRLTLAVKSEMQEAVLQRIEETANFIDARMYLHKFSG